MTVQASCLFETAAAPNAQTTVYTSAARTLLDKITGYGVAAGTLTVSLVPAAGTAGATTVLAAKTFGVGEAYSFPELVGHVLQAGDFISVIASAASAVNLRISGRTVT